VAANFFSALSSFGVMFGFSFLAKPWTKKLCLPTLNRMICPEAAGLAAAFAGDPLFEDAAAEIGVPSTGRHGLGRFEQLRASQIRLASELRKLLGLVDAHGVTASRNI
jgi:hypothetical protein